MANNNNNVKETNSDDIFSNLGEKLNKFYDVLNKDILNVLNEITEFKVFIGTQLNDIKVSVESNTKSIQFMRQEIDETKSSLTARISQLEIDLEHIKAKRSIDEIPLDNSLMLNDSSQNSHLNSLEKQVKDLKEALDDQVNRNCRQTMVFWGVPENQGENTTTVLADVLAKATKTKRPTVLQYLDRVHRGKLSEKYPNNPRPIYAKFTTWKHAQNYNQNLIKYNQNIKNDDERKVFVDQLYSNEISKRRKIAREEIKTLKAQEKNLKCFIKYPAKVMVKRGENYVIHSQH